jgi:AcrR family transcriptional regulator
VTATDAGPTTRSPARRGEAARAAIMRGAFRLIAEQGASFTTQDLVRESGVALQTFYRHFGGTDQLMVAVITEIVEANCRAFDERAAELDGPIERLHLFVDAALARIHSQAPRATPMFVASEHARLHELFPDEMVKANQPYADLVERELRAANEQGLADSSDPAGDAWLVTTLVRSVYHHYAFHPDDPAIDAAADDVWRFCLGAIRRR